VDLNAKCGGGGNAILDFGFLIIGECEGENVRKWEGNLEA
jgi:hypothetical protein